LKFADIIKWPYKWETISFAEEAYPNLREGKEVPGDLWDWLYGIVLPGKWAAFKIMAALVLCTPSLRELGVAYRFDMGLSLPRQSYWRSRTVLGRVLASCAGVKSICGWVGPCPPIDGPHTKYIHLKARHVEPPKLDSKEEAEEEEGSLLLREGEDRREWIAELKDPTSWTAPQPPVREMSLCKVERIQVKALPREVRQKIQPVDKEEEPSYRASIDFSIDNQSVRYVLYNNPVFITPPICLESPHKAHIQQLPKFQRNTCTVEQKRFRRKILRVVF